MPDALTPRFLNRLRAEFLPGHRYRGLRPLRFDSAIARARIIVPRGFVSDLATVPRLPVVYLAVGATAHMSAFLHDFLYQAHLFDRATSDEIFYEAMVADDDPPTSAQRRMLFLGVRAGGQAYWDRRDERVAALNPSLVEAIQAG